MTPKQKGKLIYQFHALAEFVQKYGREDHKRKSQKSLEIRGEFSNFTISSSSTLIYHKHGCSQESQISIKENSTQSGIKPTVKLLELSITKVCRLKSSSFRLDKGKTVIDLAPYVNLITEQEEELKIKSLLKI